MLKKRLLSWPHPGSPGGGGGSGRIFFPVPAGKDQSQSLNYAIIFYISGRPADHPPFLETHGPSGRLGRSAYTFKQRNNISSLQKKTFNKSLGGPWPPAPVAPLLATPLVTYLRILRMDI